MKDAVARQRAEEAIEQVATEAELRRSAIDELRDLVKKGDAPPVITATYEPAQTGTITVSGAGGYSIGQPGEVDAAYAAHHASRIAVLTVVLCYENLRDALQFDTWGGLQDATSLNERASVLRGWLGTIAVVEMEAATACYDELAGA